MDFFVPSTKQEVLTWLLDYYKEDESAKSHFRVMGKKQLYAVYYRIRKTIAKEVKL